MYLTDDVQTALHFADLRQAGVRAAFPRGRRIHTWWPSRRLARPTAPSRPAVTPRTPRHGTPAAV